MDDTQKGRQQRVLFAINNIELVVEHIINNKFDQIDINSLMKDYNIIRQELNKILVNR